MFFLRQETSAYKIAALPTFFTRVAHARASIGIEDDEIKEVWRRPAGRAELQFCAAFGHVANKHVHAAGGIVEDNPRRFQRALARMVTGNIRSWP